jgi:AAA+ superfamily predicted ATPase
METLDRINEIANLLEMVYNITNDTTKLGWLAKEVDGVGRNSYNCVVFPSSEPYMFTIENIEYYGLTVHDCYNNPRTNGSPYASITIIFAKEFDQITMLYDYLTKKYQVVVKSNPCKVLVWSNGHGSYINSGYEVSRKTQSDLVGLDEFFVTMERDLRAITEREALSKKMGIDSGFNYLIYGKPGTGKSSSVKALAYKLDLPIYCVNLARISPNHISNALSPKDTSPIKLVLVEDFDRYIQGNKKADYMSDLLNALDGIQSTYGTIRIFSANFPENVLVDTALVSRISRFIEFKLPTVNEMTHHLLNLFPENKAGAEQLAKMVTDLEMSIREVNNYLSRFLVDKDILLEAINGFPNWLAQMKKIKELEAKNRELMKGKETKETSSNEHVEPYDAYDYDDQDLPF